MHTLYDTLIVALCLINLTNLAITANYTGRSHEQTTLGTRGVRYYQPGPAAYGNVN